MKMNSSRAYLLRALNEWILDNDCTPYIVVDVSVKGTLVPNEYVKDGQIVLNITPASVRDLVMDNEAVCFSARFGGKPHHLYAPIKSISAIYAKENGQGMVFGPDPEPAETGDEKGPESTGNTARPQAGSRDTRATNKDGKSSRPQLKIIK